MKNAVLTLALLWLPLPGLTQKEVTPSKPDCDSLFRAGDSHLRRQNLQQALQCYLGAMNCDTRLAGKVGPKIEEVFGRIERQRRSEVAAKEEAEKRRVEAEKLTRTTFANDLAYKSQIVLERGDRTTAFRLAEFAHRYVDDDNPNVLRALLEACYYNDHPDTLHRLPWNYNLEAHTDKVQNVAFSPDGRRLITASDVAAKVWDLESGKVTHTLEDNSHGVKWASFLPDGRPLAILLYLHSGGIAEIWDLESAKILRTIENFGWASPSVSPDGYLLAAGADGGVKIWGLDSGKVVQILQEDSTEISRIVFSPDNRHIASNSYNGSEINICIWDCEKGKVVRIIKNFSMTDNISFSPDNRWLATIEPLSTTVKLWNLANGEVGKELGDGIARASYAMFSPDGSRLAVGLDDGTIKIWECESGKATQTLKGLTARVSCIAFSPDGRWLAAGFNDGSIKVWELDTRPAAQTLKFKYDRGWKIISFSPDGQYIAAAFVGGSMQIRNLRNGKVVQPFDGYVEEEGGISFSPDWRRLATWTASSVKIWDWESRKIIRTSDSLSIAARDLLFSPDGHYCAIIHSGGLIIWDLETGKTVLALEGTVFHVSFSPDGRYVVSSLYGEDMKIWDLTIGKAVTRLEGAVDFSASFSPDGFLIATGGIDGSAKIWKMENGKLARTLKIDNEKNRAVEVSFSPDGRWLATCLTGGKNTQVWAVESGQLLITLNGLNPGFQEISFSPDGSRLATTGTISGDVYIWDLAPDTLIERSKMIFADSAGITVAQGTRRLSTLTTRQLQEFGLEKILHLDGPGATNNEVKLIAAGETQQITAFADLYTQNARNSRNLNSATADYARAARLYRAVFESGGDSVLLHRLGELYSQWADDILSGSRPDTALPYIRSACQFYPDENRCYDLHLSYADKTGRSPDTKPEDAEALQRLADYFFEKKNWDKAIQLYEESETLEHSRYNLKQLYEISAKTALGFDFQRFLASPFAGELRYYAHYFYGKGKWQEARQLYEKAEQIEHHPAILIRLCQATEMTGQAFDFQRFLSSNAPDEVTQYAIYFFQKADTCSNYRDRIPDYRSALLLREKQLTLDTTIATRLEVANEYNSLAFYQLFLPDGAAAEASLRRAFELDPTNKYIPTNRAPALLLQGRWAEAEVEYRKWKDVEFGENNQATYRDAFLADLDELEKQSVTHPDFARARTLLNEN